MRSSHRHVICLIWSLASLNISRTLFIPNPNVINEWNKLDSDIRSSSSYNLFCKTLLKFIRPVQKKTFNINDSVKVKLLTRLRLGFSHLRDHKFRHAFRDIFNLLCPCSMETKATTHYFLHCHVISWWQREPQHFNVHQNIHQRFSKN